MIDYNKLVNDMERVINKFNRTEARVRNYGKNMKLSRAEIHTIEAIGNNQGINVTNLAILRGITKGAVSQMIYKLVKKGAVYKSISPDSDTEVKLELTKEGWNAYKIHKKYHEINNEKFLELLKDIPGEVCLKLENFLHDFEKSLDEKL